MRGEGIEREAKRLCSFGIVMFCIGIINPVFFILGIIFLVKSNKMYHGLEEELPDRIIENQQ